MTPLDGPLILDRADLALLARWAMSTTDPRAKKIMIIGRIQRRLGVLDDGLWGPQTEEAVTKASARRFDDYTFSRDEWTIVDKMRRRSGQEEGG